MPDCLFKIRDWQREKKRRNNNRRSICNATRGIEAGLGVIRLRGVSDVSDGAPPLRRSHSAWTEMFFADEAAGIEDDQGEAFKQAVTWSIVYVSTYSCINTMEDNGNGFERCDDMSWFTV